ncbi:MAG: alpha/beta hydrolase [Pseudomonadota bacterium]
MTETPDAVSEPPSAFSACHGVAAARNPFDPSLVSKETETFNQSLLETLSALADPWASPPHIIRKARAEGKGPFPLEPKLEAAQWIEKDGVRLRVIAPDVGEPRGVFLHIHGGGWMYGQADFQDPMLARFANATGFLCASVAYRLAPEHPFPAAPDDCMTAALWAFSKGLPVVLGGESAGANLAVLTALGLRERRLDAAGLVLLAGCFDLSLTPSARSWGSDKLVLNTRDISLFAANYVPAFIEPRSPAVSPLYASLEGLPPCFISVGTADPLLDDSLFLHSRLCAAGVRSELAVAPGGCHVFHVYDLQISREAETATHAFIDTLVDTTP